MGHWPLDLDPALVYFRSVPDMAGDEHVVFDERHRVTRAGDGLSWQANVEERS